MKALLSVYLSGAGYRPDCIPVLQDCRIQVGVRELALMVGRNGCGKSTLLRALAGDPQTYLSGTVEFAGKRVTCEAREWRNLGVIWVPQEGGAFDELTVRENLATVAEWAGAEGVQPALALFPELAHLAHRKVGNLSGGERRMVEVAAAALLPNPALLLFDEPTAALSAENSIRFVAFVEERLRGGSSVLVATHNDELRALDHRIIEMSPPRAATEAPLPS